MNPRVQSSVNMHEYKYPSLTISCDFFPCSGGDQRVLFLQRAVRGGLLPDGVPGRTMHLSIRDVAHLGQRWLCRVQRSVSVKSIHMAIVHVHLLLLLFLFLLFAVHKQCNGKCVCVCVYLQGARTSEDPRPTLIRP